MGDTASASKTKDWDPSSKPTKTQATAPPSEAEGWTPALEPTNTRDSTPPPKPKERDPSANPTTRGGHCATLRARGPGTLRQVDQSWGHRPAL